ncbi:histidine phosphatase family protein [Candidatus Saccharibacteria bacterium]|nr:histidine phosphatase family protein [Candidatus Saccharibacteria bacterium]
MAQTIFIARHGQDEDNSHGILNGQRDTPLTDIGREQANVLAEQISKRGLSFDHILSSPLKRAYETAQIITNKINFTKPIQVLPDLIERDFGILTGKPVTDIARVCGDNVIKTDRITYFLSPKGAETFPQLIQRGRKVLSEIDQQNLVGNILLVCHGDIGQMIYAAATGKPWREVLTEFRFGNGDLIEPNSDNPHVLTQTQHNL